MRYFEDLAVGQVYELGTWKITAEDIVDFAQQWDPQPYHLDEESARQTPFGGLVASGWHTASVFMRLYVDGFLRDTSCQGGVGVDGLWWLKPVRPGDTLQARVTVEEAKPSSKVPDRGTVKFAWELRNQHGELVLRMHGVNLFGRRAAGAAGTSEGAHPTP